MASTSYGGSGSATAVVELNQMSPEQVHTAPEKSDQLSWSGSVQPAPSRHSDQGGQPLGGSPLPTPNTAVEVVEKWNYPRRNVPRVLSLFFSFFVFGMNDAAYGALVPYLEEYYHLSYTVVSLVFLSPFAGYTVSAIFNNWIHLHVGRRGVAISIGICHVVAYIIACVHPPYAALVVAYAIVGLGNGLIDAAWNSWVGNMANANEVLGLMHGIYGAGAVISPLLATSMITRYHLQWYYFYYVMIGAAAVELATTAYFFWPETAQVYRESVAQGGGETSNNTLKEALFKKPWARVTWLCAFFLLGYVGTEVALGGWIVNFMLQVRHAGQFASGMTATGFWLGLMVGRLILGFITPRIGEKLAISIYLPIAMGLELLFWLVPQFYVSAVAVALQGFFIGPLFPAAVVAATKLLPRHLHVTAIGFAAAFGGGGAAVLPFVVGAIAQAKGVKTLQPIILSFLAAVLLLWLALPRIHKKRD